MSDSLKSRLQSDLAQARKDRDKLRTLVLSTTLSEVRNREIELGGEADDEQVQAIVTKAIKQRRDAADQMRSGGRPELAEKEESELQLLMGYLPPQLSEDEVRTMVREIVASGAPHMGAVMGQIMPKVRGRFDGKEVNRIVREELGS